MAQREVQAGRCSTTVGCTAQDGRPGVDRAGRAAGDRRAVHRGEGDDRRLCDLHLQGAEEALACAREFMQVLRPLPGWEGTARSAPSRGR